MGFGLTISVLIHVGVLAWALINFQSTPPLKLPEEIPVEVSIISQVDLETRQKKGDSLSKLEEAALSAGKLPSPKDAPKPKPVRVVEPPPSAASEPPPPAEPVKLEPPKPPEPAKVEPPKPDEIAALIEKTPPPPPTPDGPTPDEKRLLEERLAEQEKLDEQKKKAEAEAKKKADDKKIADDKKRADDLAKKKLADEKKKRDDAAKKAADLAKKKQFDASQIAELLNKVPDQPSAAAGADTPPSKSSTAKGPTAGTKTGTDTVNKARAEQMVVAMLTSAFKECWSKPLAGGGVAAPAVKLRWTLNQDGTIQAEPRVMQSDRNNPLAEQAERAAIRAVHSCVPFQLPPDQYNVWREITWNFNPDQAL